MSEPKTGATQYHADLGHPDKGLAIKGLVVFNIWILEPLDLLNCMTLGCKQPSPEVWGVIREFERLKGYLCKPWEL